MSADLLDLIAGRAIELGLPWVRSREYNVCECRDGQHDDLDLDTLEWGDYIRAVRIDSRLGDHAHLVERHTVSASTRAEASES